MTEKEFIEAAQELHEAIEANFARFYQRVSSKPVAKGSPKLTFDAEKIPWKFMTRDDGSNWQLASDAINLTNVDYLALKDFLRNAGGRVQSEGKFYWLMDTAVGRQDAKTVKHAQK